jgi:hypothetical protein
VALKSAAFAHILGGRLDADALLALGRGLHSFPFLLKLSLLCRFPLNLSSLCPACIPNQPVDVAHRAQVEL